LSTSLAAYTAKKIPFMYSHKRNCAASVPISTSLCLSVSDLYICRIGQIFSCKQNRQNDPGNICIGHRHKNVEIGTVAAQTFSGNICFKFSLLCLCSVVSGLNLKQAGSSIMADSLPPSWGSQRHLGGEGQPGHCWQAAWSEDERRSFEYILIFGAQRRAIRFGALSS
jgi:hypothetical protein